MTTSLSALIAQDIESDIEITGLALDSREVSNGDLFLAVRGENFDGRDYLGSAAQAGAAAILAEAGLSISQRSAAGACPVFEKANLAADLSAIGGRFYGAPSADMFLAGVTGTNGKTTTSRLVAQLLRSHAGSCGVMGTLGVVLDDSVDEALNTTPDAITVQRELASWRAAGVRHASMEISSHALVQGRVADLSIDVAVLTNLSHDHLDYHGDMQRYADAKALLFQHAGLSAAVLNWDDPFAHVVAAQLQPSVDLVSYALNNREAAIHALEIQHEPSGIAATINTPWGQASFMSPLVADFNLANLLAAIAVAGLAGMPLTEICACIPELKGVPGRMEYVANSLDLQLVVDYSHTPDALLQALTALQPHTPGRLICVFGCGGDRDAEKRPLMGRVATENADRVIITSDNPRGENPETIIQDVLSGCEVDVEVEVDRALAIERAVATALPGDCVLVAGKGHETYQLVGNERFPFSDVKQLRLAAQGVIR